MRRSPHAPALRATALALALVAGLAPLLAGCATADDSAGAAAPPDRPADVDGTVDRDEGAPRLVDASDPYYEGMSLLSASTVVLDADGERVDGAALVDGDAVEVWAEVCAESYPVQCQVVAVRVVG
ncbi:hypothetical protein ACIOWF_12700 [Cellulosimicrobium cellulans]|uniref:DUF5666 domain-containing protein n=1 Tax=Cellulosimicrobium cellulans F16 TaxID=1350482 RepID=A0A0M0F9W9_CELCE|nr:hypothetical protein [Cellulosimicrobium cellulans]KON74182.1 hypothetical protein M768_08740 [Cellulosimicrobium cellulans F16]